MLRTPVVALKLTVKRTGNDPVQFWFNIEVAPKGGKGKLHLQGSLLISSGEEAKARKAMHKMNGVVEITFKSRALWFLQQKRLDTALQKGMLYADLNWAMYNHKENSIVKRFFADQHTGKLRQVFTASRELNKKAEELYNQLRLMQK